MEVKTDISWLDEYQYIVVMLSFAGFMRRANLCTTANYWWIHNELTQRLQNLLQQRNLNAQVGGVTPLGTIVGHSPGRTQL